MLLIGDQKRGAMPARTMARVVVYEVLVIDRSRYSDSGRKPAFYDRVSIMKVAS